MKWWDIVYRQAEIIRREIEDWEADFAPPESDEDYEIAINPDELYGRVAIFELSDEIAQIRSAIQGAGDNEQNKIEKYLQEIELYVSDGTQAISKYEKQAKQSFDDIRIIHFDGFDESEGEYDVEYPEKFLSALEGIQTTVLSTASNIREELRKILKA